MNKTGNPYPHRYKHGKITTPIDFDSFEKGMQTLKARFDPSKYRAYGSYFAFLYWFGVRRSEPLDMKASKDFFWLSPDKTQLFVNPPCRKGGERKYPLYIDKTLPYVDLIIEHVNMCKPDKKVWSFSARTGLRIVKYALGEKYYCHFLRLNRATNFLNDPSTIVPEMKGWFGWKSAQTIDSYVGYSKRHIQKQSERLKQEVQTT